MTVTTTKIEMAAPEPSRIADVTSADLDAVARLEAESFLTPWHLDSFRDALGRPYSLFLALHLDDRLIGYSLSWVVADELHILKFAVEETQRRNGFGRRLLAETLRRARAANAAMAWLEVRPSNEAAIALYSHHGFHKAYTRKKYYADTGEDALIFMCDLLALEKPA